jgi:hypothetical protein
MEKEQEILGMEYLKNTQVKTGKERINSMKYQLFILNKLHDYKKKIFLIIEDKLNKQDQ